MNLTLLILAICFGGLSVYVPLHVSVFRFLRPEKRWGATRGLFLIVLPLVLIVTAWVSWRAFNSPGGFPTSPVVDVFACFTVLALLHLGYLTFYAFIDRSITLRTFIEIKNADEPLTFQDLAKRYDTEAAYLRRLEILWQSGYLAKTGGSYELTSKGVFVGNLIRRLKSLYKLGPGG